ncbi:colicin-like bacteriocin tRNase domain-containing protein [Serratia sp. S4]|uniref:colicin-like bacteriocin tRNase domain-containing protein n=1 Tax=Serratia sp. S4 TaxID=768491 RepID=UPI000372CE8B|nr:colicin-like bacteriocin tRNase domain-containing protein [Serratia sp. S4]
MSGGDGKDSRGPGGGVNGGPTGLGGNGNKGGGVDASDHSGWSSENDPWGSKNTGGNTGGGNNGGDRDHPTGSGKVNLSLFPEAQASIALGAPTNISLVDGLWGFSLLKSKTVQSVITEALAKVKTLGVPTVGTLWRGSLWGLVVEGITPTKIAPDDMSMVRHITTTLPADLVTKTPLGQLPTQPATVVDARLSDVVDEGQQKVAVIRSPSMPMSVPVVEAKPTKRPDVFTAGIVPGMPDIHIRVNAPAPPTAPKPPDGVSEVKDAPAKQLPASAPGGNTHDGIVVFPTASNLPPVYVAVVEVMPVNEVNAREIERKALQTYQDARQRREFAQTDEQRKITSYQTLLPELTITQRQIEETQAEIAFSQVTAKRQSVQETNAKSRRQPALAEQYHREMDRTNKTVSALNDALFNLREKEKDIVAQRAEFARLGKENWKKERPDRERTDPVIATWTPAQQSAFWQTQARKEFVLSVTSTDLPKYGPVMGTKPSPLYMENQAYFWKGDGFALANYDAIAANDTLVNGIRRAFSSVSTPLASVAPNKLYENGQVMASELAQFSFVFYEDLDVSALTIVSSLDVSNFGLSRDDTRNALGGYGAVQMPYRLVSRRTGLDGDGDERIHIDVVRPDDKNLVGAVPLRAMTWNAVKRESSFTSDDGAITLTWRPASDKDVSGYQIIVTPLGSQPGKLYRGGHVDVSSKGARVTLPLVDVQKIHDYILVPPVESGLDPIYVMFNKPRKKAGKDDKPVFVKPRQGTAERGHEYHPTPKTDEIKGLGELKPGRPKTPKQSGGGLRARWYGDKGRKIYEWDSRHGELEGYRASDGEHLGAFDPKTGKQLEGPNPKRNIKKYL